MTLVHRRLQATQSVQSTADDALMALVASGDREAFGRLYELTSESVFGFALSITKNTHDAQDILQEVFIKVWESAAQYQPMGKPMAWILTVAKNLCLMKLREHSKLMSSQEPWEENDEFSTVSNDDDRLALETAMAVLSDEERQIVMLKMSGLKHRETADVLSLPLSTVLSKYNRALKKLRQSLTEGGYHYE